MTETNENKQPFILIGYMGSGKSYVCKRLGARLGLKWIDLDDVIEAHAGKSISAIFVEDGHDAFRKLEHECLVQLLDELEYDLISAGGGAPCYWNNMALMNARAQTIYLRRDAQAILKYVLPGIDHRPLLSGKQPDEIEEYIKQTLAEREPYYLQARFILEDLESEALLDAVQQIMQSQGPEVTALRHLS
ncbi:MAG: shikimate kinase [Saprospiraceae bacterium]|nr:shikimate kinase [Saprospiraceae bacterium]